jgi:hypothetical protein
MELRHASDGISFICRLNSADTLNGGRGEVAKRRTPTLESSAICGENLSPNSVNPVANPSPALSPQNRHGEQHFTTLLLLSAKSAEARLSSSS